MAAAGKSATVVLSSASTYAFLVVALVGSVLLGYIVKLFPADFANVGIATSLTGIVTYLAHDLEATHTPKGLPKYTSFVIVSVATAAYGAVGVFTGQSLLELGATLTWVVSFLTFLLTYVKENGPTALTPSELAWATAGIGFAVAFLSWWEGHLNATALTVVVTFISLFGQYFHLSETGGSISVTAATPG